MKQSVVTAYYNNSSQWELDFDIDAVHEWWIKWDTLYVIHNPGEEAEEYQPLYGAQDGGFKRPDDTEADVFDVEETA